MSLRTRLVLSYILIVVLCLALAAISLAVLLQKYRDQTNLQRLEDVSKPIYNQLRSLLKGQASLLEVWTDILEQAQTSKIYILFVDANGNLVRGAAPNGREALPGQFGEGNLPHVTVQSHGVFTMAGGQRLIYVAYPLSRLGPGTLAKQASVVLAQPRGTAAGILAGVIVPFIWAGIVALAVSVALAFWLARSVYRPIQGLSRAAAAIAHGNYDAAVPVAGPTEIKGLAVAFNEMAAKVKASQQQLRHFVADVSHQLKTPLTSIKGFAEAMLDGTASDAETRNKASHIIVDESNRMIRQVNELLELSRMQSGQLKIAREPVDLRGLLQQCLDIFTLRMEEKKVRAEAELAPSLSVVGDADRLEDVFSNLLDNAIKNTPAGGEIHVTARSADNKNAEVIITDTGPGIPPEQLPYVFDRFTHVSGMRSGFGLGLAIAREIVLAHGGKIEVTSDPGEGARFTVTLPVS